MAVIEAPLERISRLGDQLLKDAFPEWSVVAPPHGEELFERRVFFRDPLDSREVTRGDLRCGRTMTVSNGDQEADLTGYLLRQIDCSVPWYGGIWLIKGDAECPLLRLYLPLLTPLWLTRCGESYQMERINPVEAARRLKCFVLAASRADEEPGCFRVLITSDGEKRMYREVVRRVQQEIGWPHASFVASGLLSF